MFWAFFNNFTSPMVKADSRGLSKPGINSPALTSPSMQPSSGASTPDRDLSGLKRRALVKSPAKKTAKPAAPVAKQRAKASAAPAAAKNPVKAAAKPAAKVAPKPSVKKPVAKTPVKKAAVKPASKSTSKPVVKSAKASVKKTEVKTVAKKAPAKSAVKAPAAKAPTKKTVVKAASPKTAPKTAVKTVSKPSTVSRAPAVPVKPVPAPAVVVAPTKPVGKRAAKKVMMEQMTQAEVIPTHAPDAAKATFSQTPERFMTPLPVQSPVKKDAKRANNWKTTSVEQLADADVMAMPDSEYMNDVQQAFFRRKLLQLKADMLANAGETTEHLREDTSVMPDPADRATIEEEHALELRTRDRERKLLKKIEQAIARIDAGDYGYCDETGEPIGVGRLMARPTANLSLEAQQRRELKQKMFGD
jgi:DnaK suppressor protein